MLKRNYLPGKRVRRAIHRAAAVIALVMAFGCSEVKLFAADAESDCEGKIEMLQAAQPHVARPRHVSEPVYTAHHHQRQLCVAHSISDAEASPVEGHRLANGLCAPLTT